MASLPTKWGEFFFSHWSGAWLLALEIYFFETFLSVQSLSDARTDPPMLFLTCICPSLSLFVGILLLLTSY